MEHRRLSGEVRAAGGGLDLTGAAHVVQFMERAMDRGGDPLLAVREAMAERVVRDHLRGAADVHFNAMASLRLRLHGPAVAVGDVVCLDPAQAWDAVAVATEATPLDDRHFAPLHHDDPARQSEILEVHKDSASTLHVVESRADAARFHLRDVVLPKVGSFRHGASDETFSAFPAMPTNRCGEAVFGELLQSLKLEGLPTLDAAPLATYRRLAVRPLACEVHCWDDKLGIAFGDRAVGGKSPAIPTWVDADEVRRLVPFGAVQPPFPPRGAARWAIKEPEARRALLSAARGAGVTTALRITLPVGAALSSALREVFSVSMMDAATIARMVTARRPDQSQRRDPHERRSRSLSKKHRSGLE
jgi:hypothetical protein